MSKTAYLVSLVLLFTILFSCEPKVRFEESQPAGTATEKAFKSEYLGKYVSKDDPYLSITISQQSIIQEINEDLTIHPSQLDSTDFPGVDLKNKQEVMQAFSEDGYTVSSKNDSINAHRYKKTVLFELNDHHELKLYQNMYFLNYKIDEKAWEVSTVKLSRGKILRFGEITSPSDLENLKDLSNYQEIKDDSGNVISYSAKPDEKELKRFIRKRGVLKERVFVKVK